MLLFPLMFSHPVNLKNLEEKKKSYVLGLENKAVRVLGRRNHFRMRLLGNPIREKTDFDMGKEW